MAGDGGYPAAVVVVVVVVVGYCSAAQQQQVWLAEWCCWTLLEVRWRDGEEEVG